jgi:hypothetical protein
LAEEGNLHTSQQLKNDTTSAMTNNKILCFTSKQHSIQHAAHGEKKVAGKSNGGLLGTMYCRALSRVLTLS